MSVMSVLPKKLRHFARSEGGGMTVLGLFLSMGVLIIGGIAIDSSRLQARTTLMQITADSAAYAAAQSRVFTNVTAATAVAVNNARGNMPPRLYGNAVTSSDVQWGTWNATSRTFTPATAVNINTATAVRVTVRQTRARRNPFHNVLMGWVGVPVAEPTRVAIVMNDLTGAPCDEGFSANGWIDVQSNNLFKSGFCFFSNTGVSLNSNNIFEPGVTVTVPRPVPSPAGDIQFANGSGFDKNAGLEADLRAGSGQIYLLSTLPRIIESLGAGVGSPFLPSYITDRSSVTRLSASGNLTSGQLRPGGVYYVDCGAGGGTATIGANQTIRDVVLVTNCAVKFGNGAKWQQSILATSNTGSKSVDFGTSNEIGAPGRCTTGGGSQILTMGSVSFPAGLKVDGGQIIAARDVGFSANASGTTVDETKNGISIIAGGEISGTSNMVMSSCGGRGMELNLKFPIPMMVY